MSETEVLAAFECNWHHACIEGWYVSNDCFVPPKGHEAKSWAAESYMSKHGIYVPQWFTDFYPLKREDKVLLSFEQNHFQALKDGWYIAQEDRKSLVPPKGHKAKSWAAEWYPSIYGIYVPDWFIDFYPLK